MWARRRVSHALPRIPTMTDPWLTDRDVARFRAEGYLLAERLFDDEEIELLGAIARADHALVASAAGRRDGQGGVVKLSLSNDLKDDIYGAFVRCRRVVDA